MGRINKKRKPYSFFSFDIFCFLVEEAIEITPKHPRFSVWLFLSLVSHFVRFLFFVFLLKQTYEYKKYKVFSYKTFPRVLYRRSFLRGLFRDTVSELSFLNCLQQSG